MSTQSRHGPITRRVIEALRRQMRMKVVDLATFRAGQEHAEALETYSRHESGAIFLHGLPDVAESRPHSTCR